MFFSSTVNSSIQTSKSVLILEYFGQRRLVRAPEDFQTLRKIAIEKFHFAETDKLRFETTTLNGCIGYSVEIDEDAWESVSNAVAVLNIYRALNRRNDQFLRQSIGDPSRRLSELEDYATDDDSDEDENVHIHVDRGEADDEDMTVELLPEPVFFPDPSDNNDEDSSSDYHEVEEELRFSSESPVIVQKESVEAEQSVIIKIDRPSPEPEQQPSQSEIDPEQTFSSSSNGVLVDYPTTSSSNGAAEQDVHASSAQPPSLSSNNGDQQPGTGRPLSSSMNHAEHRQHVLLAADELGARRFRISIEHQIGGLQMFKTKGRHTVKKVLSHACRTFGLREESARLIMIIEVGDGLEEHLTCVPEDTMDLTGATEGSRFIMEGEPLNDGN